MRQIFAKAVLERLVREGSDVLKNIRHVIRLLNLEVAQ